MNTEEEMNSSLENIVIRKCTDRLKSGKAQRPNHLNYKLLLVSIYSCITEHAYTVTILFIQIKRYCEFHTEQNITHMT